MLKKTITYTNLFDDTQVTEEFYFNLTKAEMIEMAAGGYEEVLQKMLETKNTGEMLKLIKELVGKAVGKRSEDGKRFIKSQEITDEFLQSEAFSELFMELVTSEGKQAEEFFMGLMPKGLGQQAQATILPVNPPKISEPDAAQKASGPDKPWLLENREPTRLELTGMTKEEIIEAYRNKPNH